VARARSRGCAAAILTFARVPAGSPGRLTGLTQASGGVGAPTAAVLPPALTCTTAWRRLAGGTGPPPTLFAPLAAWAAAQMRSWPASGKVAVAGWEYEVQGSAGGRAILTIFARGTNYCRTVRREHVHQRVKLRVRLPDGAAFFACFDAKCVALRRQPGAQRPTPPAYEALPPHKTLREFERAHSR